MILIGGKRCKFEGCIKHASCNKPGLKTGLYCSKHKLEGMILIGGKRCEFEGCIKHATCNKPGLKSGLYCSMNIN